MIATDIRPEMAADEARAFDVAKVLGVLKAGKLVIATTVAVMALLAMAYLVITPPTFHSDALIQVQDDSSTALPGMAVLQEFSGTPDGADAEIQIIRSRSVLGATVDKLNLSTIAEPSYFPFIGYAIARFRAASPEVADSVKTEKSGNWFANYNWTLGNIRVDRFEVPTRLFDVEFTIRALGTSEFLVYGPNGQKVLSGSVGAVAEGRTTDGDVVEIFVSEIGASSFPSDYRVTKQHWLLAVEDLQKDISISELGRDSSIISISLEGADAEKVTRVVNNIAETYLRQNVEARSKQAERRLEFLDQQLPELRHDVEAAEERLNAYRKTNHALDLGVEARSLLDQVVQIEQQISEFQLKRAELQQTYTSEHPYIKAIDVQVRSLNADRQRLEFEIGELPETQREMLGLQRDVGVNTSLYVQLLNNAQELRLLKAGTTGNVRIIDRAVLPVEAVKPQGAYVLLAAIFFGLVAGASITFAQAAFRSRLASPANVEKAVGLHIYAAIPFSDAQDRHARKKHRTDSERPIILALDSPDELATESMRSLRTSMHFAMKDGNKHRVLITAPSPNAGKSFISINLAVLLAETGKTVALIDGDLRKGQLARFGTSGSRDIGFAEILSGAASLDMVVQNVRDTSVALIARGHVPPNPAELLMRPTLPEFLELVDSKFDAIVIDAPPVLAVSDAAVISSALPGISTFMVVRAGEQRIGEVEEAVRRLTIQHCAVAGVLFNAVRKKDLETDSEHSHYYQYEYR